VLDVEKMKRRGSAPDIEIIKRNKSKIGTNILACSSNIQDGMLKRLTQKPIDENEKLQQVHKTNILLQRAESTLNKIIEILEIEETQNRDIETLELSNKSVVSDSEKDDLLTIAQMIRD